MLPSIQQELKSILGSHFEVYSALPLSGGDINVVMKLTTSKGDLCIKMNDAQRFPFMFEREAEGLRLLREGSSFTVPEVIAFGEAENTSFLLLEFLKSAEKRPDFWEDFGQKLATMHQSSNTHFGLENANYIGSLTQENSLTSDWGVFYAEERILPQARLARDKRLLDSSDLRKIEVLCQRFNQLFPEEAPALLHGDLWSGNYMTDANGKPALIDPSVYYGHREMDLGMSLLFGGFAPEMYTAYNESYPLERNWKKRVELCQLYPILVHVNLFGHTYVRQARRIIENFS